MFNRLYECLAVLVVCLFCLFIGFSAGEFYGEDTISYNRGWNVGYGSGYNRCQWDLVMDDHVHPERLRPHVLVENKNDRPNLVDFVSNPEVIVKDIVHAPGRNRGESEQYVHNQ